MVRKIYHVELNKNLKIGDMKLIAEGIELEDGFMQVDEIAFDGDGSDKKMIGLQIHSGKNRIVRRIFEHLGYEVIKLERVRIMNIGLKGLAPGDWRDLTESEMKGIYSMVAESSGVDEKKSNSKPKPPAKKGNSAMPTTSSPNKSSRKHSSAGSIGKSGRSNSTKRNAKSKPARRSGRR
jgi:hypothetical protein